MPTLGPWLFLLLTGFFLYATRGHYHPTLAPLLPALWLPFFIKTSRGKQLETPLWFFLGFVCLLTTTITPLLIYDTNKTLGLGINLCFGLALLVLIFMAWKWKADPSWLNARQDCLFYPFLILIGLALVLVVVVSPKPYIDVWTVGQEAVAAFLSGVSPYSIQYTQFGNVEYETFFGYPPLVLLWYVPWYLCGDIRFGYAFAHLATACILFECAKSTKIPSPLPLLIAIAFLAFPIMPFMIEQSWIDPASMALGAGMLWAYQKKRVWSLAFLAVLFLNFKFTHIIAAPLLFLLLYKLTDKLVRLVLFMVVIDCLLNVPFMLWDLKGYMNRVLWMLDANALTGGKAMTLFIREDALSLIAWSVRVFEQPWPTWLCWVPAALIVPYGVYRTYRASFEQAPWAFYAIAFVFVAFFTLSSWAFCNYYWFATLGVWIALAHGPLYQENQYRL